MRMVDLSEANLTNANLERALLVGADLLYADLSQARLKGVVLNNRQVSDEQLGRVRSKPIVENVDPPADLNDGKDEG
jgi:uncharacterized protein YjbI with pentapeptide repeats